MVDFSFYLEVSWCLVEMSFFVYCNVDLFFITVCLEGCRVYCRCLFGFCSDTRIWFCLGIGAGWVERGRKRENSSRDFVGAASKPLEEG